MNLRVRLVAGRRHEKRNGKTKGKGRIGGGGDLHSERRNEKVDVCAVTTRHSTPNTSVSIIKLEMSGKAQRVARLAQTRRQI